MKTLLWIPMLAIICVAREANAVDRSNGSIGALPVALGKVPIIDGDLKEWDWSGSEPMWISEQTARTMNSQWALLYDDKALYIGVRTGLPNRPLSNPNDPQDAFWQGDILQIRLSSDPNLPYPLDNGRDKASDRVAHISLWKNTATGKDFLQITKGTSLDKGQEVNPAGSSVSIREETNSYVVEARVPWSALGVPDGVNPFKAGQRTAAVIETLWTGGDAFRVASVYRANPGAFAFNSPDKWGQIEFLGAGATLPIRTSWAELLAGFEAKSGEVKGEVGVPIIIDVPYDSKVSINIFGEKGEVLRELVGGLPRSKGKFEVRFDGLDQWKQPLKPGTYRWGAYFSKGLKAEYVGGVGKSGQTYYETPDGKGSWGGDHSNPIDVAADSSGIYLLWPVAEAGRAVVKLDYNGKILWRKTPFVGGGFGPFYAIASDGKTVYLSLGTDNTRLVRLDAATGQLMTWGEAGAELSIDNTPITEVNPKSSPMGEKNRWEWGAAPVSQPQIVGLATNGREVFVPIYSKNQIRVLDTKSGQQLRVLDCAGPRGVTLSVNGDLYAVSYIEQNKVSVAKIVRFRGAKGAAQAVVTTNLAAPWDVAVAANGRLFVSDLGNAQQVKNFDAKGGLLKRLGTPGGRAWQGRYDSKGFLHPAGLALDKQGGLTVAQSAIPKVFTRLDAKSGKLLQEWFGSPVYWASTWPSIDNPRDVYVPHGGGIASYLLPAKGDQSRPTAYYALPEAGYPHSGNFEAVYIHPEWVRGTNGRDYLVSDGNPHTVAVKDGDKLRPVANFIFNRADNASNKTGKHYLEIWVDQNGDGQIAVNELSQLDTVEGQPMAWLADVTDSMHMEPNGDLYFMTHANRIMKLPGAGFGGNGLMRWNPAAASYVVPSVLPSRSGGFETTHRHGLHGARIDQKGDIYTIFNTTVDGNGKPFEYATPEIARQMKEGMGHTSSFNVVKVAKFNPQGKLLWMAGRKATAAAKPGEMFHFWNMAGLVNDRYIAGGSEWGQIYFYTHDGFFVDALMNNPGLNPPPGPYTFGGETSGGRVQYFPKLDELWAYSSGMAYKVAGFKNGKVEGESRVSGAVQLDMVYEPVPVTTQNTVIAPLQIAALAGDPLADGNLWNGVPTAKLTTLATAQLGYDAQNLYARIQVNDASPLQNGADTITTAFKGGDTAGIVLGPIGDREQPGAGDIRIMAAQINGQPKLIAMKAVTNGAKHPNNYSTPAGGDARFEFVGEVLGGKVTLTPDANGYTVTFAVPRAFLEFELGAGKELKGDVEVRLSGNGQRGLQATSRNYLFTPATTATTMVDDVPTESRLYPGGWGKVEIK